MKKRACSRYRTHVTADGDALNLESENRESTKHVGQDVANAVFEHSENNTDNYMELKARQDANYTKLDFKASNSSCTADHSTYDDINCQPDSEQTEGEYEGPSENANEGCYESVSSPLTGPEHTYSRLEFQQN